MLVDIGGKILDKELSRYYEFVAGLGMHQKCPSLDL
jgi:hypothetical protein